MVKTKYISSLFLLSMIVMLGCKKDFDSPPVKVLPEGSIITIDSARNIYIAFDTTIVDDISIYGIVTADESSGNIYKELFIQDETNAIKLGLTASSDYFIGDKIRVAIKGATITRDNNMVLIDNIDPETSIVRQESNLDLTPEVVTLSDIAIAGLYSPYQAKLVQINNVEFICSDVCNSWANAITQSDENRMLTDTLGNQIIVRSSGFSSFAGQTLPQGQGSIIAVVSRYSSDLQLTIRTPSEFTMSGTRQTTCAPCPIFSHTKDFEDQSITSLGWTTKVVTGVYDWTTSDQGSTDYYAQISNFNSGNTTSEAWLISPSFDFSTSTAATLIFENAANFSGPQLEVLVSTDYDGISAPSTATWTPVTANLSPGGFTFVSSGTISLSAFLGVSTHVAFKYTGSNSDGKTWELDDIIIEAI